MLRAMLPCRAITASRGRCKSSKELYPFDLGSIEPRSPQHKSSNGHKPLNALPSCKVRKKILFEGLVGGRLALPVSWCSAAQSLRRVPRGAGAMSRGRDLTLGSCSPSHRRHPEVTVKALIYAYGTRGDVEPAVALAQAILRDGGDAVVAVPRSLVAWVAGMGVSATGVSDEALQRISSPEVRKMFEGSLTRSEHRRIAEALMQESVDEYGQILSDIARIAEESGPVEVVVHAQGLAEATHQIGEWLEVPTVLATLYPNYAPSGRYPSMLLAGSRFTSRALNRMSHSVANLIAPPAVFRRQLRSWRSERLGLGERRGYWNFRDSPSSSKKILHAFSPTLVRPADEWGGSVSTRGFWFAEEGRYRDDDGLGEYLASASPIVVTLGSLRPSDEAGTDEIIREVAEALQVHLLVVSGTSEFVTAGSDLVRVIDNVPFSWLFPRATAVVHAGGAGVSHHAVRAGVPQVTLPIHGEQLMWAKSLAELGVAPAPIMMRELTAEALGRALSEVLNSAGIARSVAAGALSMRREDGVDGAVRDLEEWVVAHSS